MRQLQEANARSPFRLAIRIFFHDITFRRSLNIADSFSVSLKFHPVESCSLSKERVTTVSYFLIRLHTVSLKSTCDYCFMLVGRVRRCFADLEVFEFFSFIVMYYILFLQLLVAHIHHREFFTKDLSTQ